MMRREGLDFRQRHRPVGFGPECDGLEDFSSAHIAGNASRLAPTLHGKAGDKIPDQALGGVDLLGSLSKRHLHFVKKVFPLRLRKTDDQPNEARQ
jgi:hypothetical protein